MLFSTWSHRTRRCAPAGLTLAPASLGCDLACVCACARGGFASAAVVECAGVAFALVRFRRAEGRLRVLSDRAQTLIFLVESAKLCHHTFCANCCSLFAEVCDGRPGGAASETEGLAGESRRGLTKCSNVGGFHSKAC